MIPSSINQTLLFSRESLREIDSCSVNQYNIPGIVLMENAARGASEIILESIKDEMKNNIVILCGSGNNGGDGYAVARHLVNGGCDVSILQLDEPKSADARTNATSCAAMGISIEPWTQNACYEAPLFIDAIFGTGLDRNVEGKYEKAINYCNSLPTPCISLDIPSGMDCDTGGTFGCCINAWITISFVGMKLGFLCETANKYLGKVEVTDIGCPQTLLQKYGNTPT
ncbi:MAG: NAD(P)H-hydrate epimerase [Phycisphaerales bacterium]|nr:NAD(P)H-hydrate epimerase [Planctomycetota bacterium]MBL6996920.1 NAD(P)H-hydrate epimerase [Phycisphaerales bacterium]